jgi:hypothetical protein
MANESNKMTAVEWLIEQLEQKGDASENLYVRRVQISIDTSDYLKLIRQAKQMEKEQMFNSFMAFESNTEENEKLFDEYYTETYGGNK